MEGAGWASCSGMAIGGGHWGLNQQFGKVVGQAIFESYTLTPTRVTHPLVPLFEAHARGGPL